MGCYLLKAGLFIVLTIGTHLNRKGPLNNKVQWAFFKGNG